MELGCFDCRSNDHVLQQVQGQLAQRDQVIDEMTQTVVSLRQDLHARTTSLACAEQALAARNRTIARQRETIAQLRRDANSAARQHMRVLAERPTESRSQSTPASPVGPLRDHAFDGKQTMIEITTT